MQLVKKILKYLGIVLLIPATYFTIALLCSYITTTPKTSNAKKDKSIYVATNGIHLEIIIPKTEIDSSLIDGLQHKKREQYLSFGWGDKTYYTKAATSLDFTNMNRLQAVFMNTPALMHVTRYTMVQDHWVEIKITPDQLIALRSYINDSFKNDAENKKIILPEISYGLHDNFYDAYGDYTCFNTCNTWVNTACKQSNIKACLWTPFDFGLLRIHKK